MFERPTDDTDEAFGETTTEPVEEAPTEAVELGPVTSQYKVLGELTDPSGVGVLGQNDAASGTPIGVQGVVPNADEGYGRFTPDDASVGGMLETGDLGASVYHSSDQTIPNQDRTEAKFDPELYDHRSEFDNASPPHAFSPDVGGTYHVESNVSFTK